MNRDQRRALRRGKVPAGSEDYVSLLLTRDEAGMVEEALDAYRQSLEDLHSSGAGNPASQWALTQSEQLRRSLVGALGGRAVHTLVPEPCPA